jgi:D-alanyl-D-alanine carboxypeptidase
MATNTKNRRVFITNIDSAKRIAGLLQTQLEADFDALRKDVKALQQRSTEVAEWEQIVEDLSAPVTVMQVEPQLIAMPKTTNETATDLTPESTPKEGEVRPKPPRTNR